jgi:putative hydrolase of the HAD superfamily
MPPEQCLMVGNSLKSDILPVAAIGGRAVYIHRAETWEHEKVADPSHTLYERIDHIGLLPDLLRKLQPEAASSGGPPMGA